jgi:hypothetical protein
MQSINLFLCYSRQDQIWRDLFLDTVQGLSSKCNLRIWYDSLMAPGIEWHRELKQQLAASQIAAALISPNLLRSTFTLEEELPHIIARNNSGGLVFLPFVLWGWDELMECREAEASWLRDLQHANVYGKQLSDITERDAQSIIRERILWAVEQIRSKPQALRSIAIKTNKRIDISRLPSLGKEFFGRRKEISILTSLWKHGHVRVVAVIAGGGYGKSTLIGKWLLDLGQHEWTDADRVFGWSFYNQGSDEDSIGSAQEFIVKALEWFGDKDPASGSPWDKGERLAKLVASKKSILILDGLEPLQWSIGQKKLKDPSLSTLIDGLCRFGNGLCILTSRQPIVELDRYHGFSATQLSLDPISSEDGVDIFRSRMITATTIQLKELTVFLGNHALAVSLLASILTPMLEYLSEQHSLAIKRFCGTYSDAKMSGVDRVLQFFVDSTAGRSELKVLYLLALFDQPISICILQELLEAHVSQSLNPELQLNSAVDLLPALGFLIELRLVFYSQKSQSLDMHPLTRMYFRQRFIRDRKSDWEYLNYRLYHMYNQKAISSPEPHNINDATSLYLAAHHLAKSRRSDELYKYYIKRIVRPPKMFSTSVLGAYGHDLMILSSLIKADWRNVIPDIEDNYHASLLREAAVAWQALGEFSLASKCMEASLRCALRDRNLIEASFTASYLSELLVHNAKLGQAVSNGCEAFRYGIASSNEEACISSLSSAGDALHQLGRLEQASRFFDLGVRYQIKYQKSLQWKRFFMHQGFHYCSLLQSLGKHKLVIDWCCSQIESGLSESISLLTLALDHISLGESMMHLSKSNEVIPQKAIYCVEKGFELAHECQDITTIPVALMAMSRLRAMQKNYDYALEMLGKMTRIASQGSAMPLYLFDAEIEELKIKVAIKALSNQCIKARLNDMEAKLRKYKYYKRKKDLAQLREGLMLGKA